MKKIFGFVILAIITIAVITGCDTAATGGVPDSYNVNITATKLDTPAGLKTVVGNGNIKLTWKPVAWASFYEIYRGTSQTAPQLIGSTASSDEDLVTRSVGTNPRRTTYIDTIGFTNILIANTTYYYYVMARYSNADINDNDSQVNFIDSNLSSGKSAKLINVPAMSSELGDTTVDVDDDGFKRYIRWYSVENADEFDVYEMEIFTSTADQTNISDLLSTSASFYGTVKNTESAGVLEYEITKKAGSYKYFIRAKKDDNYLLPSVSESTTAITAPGLATPTSFAATITTDKFVQLQWDNDPLAASYSVYRKAANETTYTELTGLSSISAADKWIMFDNTILHNVEYAYIVVAKDTTTNISLPASATVTPDPLVDAVGQPANLVASTTFGAMIQIVFDKVAEAADAESYRVYRAQSNDLTTDWSAYSELTTNIGFYESSDFTKIIFEDTDPTLVAGTNVMDQQYSYMIVAVDADNNESSFSTAATGKILHPDNVATFGAVTGITASDGTYQDKIEITWDRVKDALSDSEIAQYIIYRKLTDTVATADLTAYELLVTLNAADLTSDSDVDTARYFDTDVEPGLITVENYQYSYVVIAVDSQDRRTLFSNTTANTGFVDPNVGTETPVKKITTPTISFNSGNTTATSIAVEWTNCVAVGASNTIAATAYDFYISTRNDGTEYILFAANVTDGTQVSGDPTSLETTLSATGLDQGETYYIKVRSKNDAQGLASPLSTSDTVVVYRKGFEAVSSGLSATFVDGTDTLTVDFDLITNQYIESGASPATAYEIRAIINTATTPSFDSDDVGAGDHYATSTTLIQGYELGHTDLSNATIYSAVYDLGTNIAGPGTYNIYVVTIADNGEVGYRLLGAVADSD